MSGEIICPTCGAPLKAGQACPFCAEARRLLAQLAEQEEVRLCARCGTVLQPAEEEICDNCRRTLRARALQARREDRVARWIRDQFVEPPAEQVGLACSFCGQPMPPLALFCPYCGRKVGQGQPVPAPLSGTGEAAVTVPSLPQAAHGETSVAEAGSATGWTAAGSGTVAGMPAGPSWLQRARAFLADQFRPFVEEWRGSTSVPFGERVRALLRNLLGSGRGTPTWLWAMFFIVLAGLVGMIIFWGYLLNSGVRFR